MIRETYYKFTNATFRAGINRRLRKISDWYQDWKDRRVLEVDKSPRVPKSVAAKRKKIDSVRKQREVAERKLTNQEY